MSILIDRSNNNSSDDLHAAKKAGVSALYAKATESTGFTDSTFHERMAAGRAAGLKVGGYHFAGSAAPAAEADHFLGVIGTPKPGDLRPCLDLESGESAGWTAAFVEHVHAKLGYWPVLYGNTSTIPALRAASASVRACPFWRAEFSVNDGNQHPLQGGNMGASAHQYTSQASIAGVSGHTDASVFIDEAAMLVPTPIKHWPKPNHYGIDYTDKQGHHQHVKTKRPGVWQARHPQARWHGKVTITPVFHPIKK